VHATRIGSERGLPQGTARRAQNRARLVGALYEQLARLTEPLPAAAQVLPGR
jgi:hypothetical protein